VLVLVAHGGHHPPPGPQLLEQRVGQRAERRRHVDRIEQTALRDPSPAVGDQARHPVIAQLGQRPGGGLAQLLEPLDRDHLARQLGEQGGVVTGSGADVQHPVGRLELKQLQHPGDDQRLGDRLATGDRQRDVVVGVLAVLGGDEALAGNRRDRREHSLVGHHRPQPSGECL